MATDNNGAQDYKASRRAEAAANQAALFEQAVADFEAQLTPAEPPPSEEAPEAPAEPEVPQTIDDAAPPTTGEAAADFDNLGEVPKAIARAGPAFAANMGDRLGTLLSEASEYLGIPSTAFGGHGGRPQAIAAQAAQNAGAHAESKPFLRDKFDKQFGTPETAGGNFIQEGVGEMMALIPVLRGLRFVSGLKMAAAMPVADFVTGALGSREGQNTLAGHGLEAAGLGGEDAPILNAIFSNDVDDSTALQMVRHGVEGAALGKAFDKFVDVAMASRTARKGTEARRAMLREADELSVFDLDAEDAVSAGGARDTDLSVFDLDSADALEDVASNLAGVRSEMAGLRMARESLDDAASQADEAAEIGAFRGEEIADTTGPQREVLRESLDNNIARLEREAAELELDLDAAANGRVPGQQIEAVRQDLDKIGDGNPKALNESLGRKATERAITQVKVPEVSSVANNHLRLKGEGVESFKSAMRAGDFDGVTDVIAKHFDSTNFDHYGDGTEVTDVLKGLLNEFGDNPRTMRLFTRRAMEETEGGSAGILTRLAGDYGQSPEFIANALESQLPGRNLDQILTAYRMFEVSLVKKLNKIAGQMAESGADADLASDADFTRFAILLANVNDRRAGVASEMGRAFNALKIDVAPPGFDELTQIGRAARQEQREGIVFQAGGSPRIRRLAQGYSMALAADPTGVKASKLIKDHVREGGTLGDLSHAYVATNLLSGFPTHQINVMGPLAREMLLDPTIGILGGLLDYTFSGFTNPRTFRREMHFVRAKWRNLSSSFWLDHSVRQSSPLYSAFRAANAGQRLTVPQGQAKFLAPGEGNIMRAVDLARAVRSGLPIHVPFTGVRAKGPKLLPILPRGFRNKMGNALEAQAGGGKPLFPGTTQADMDSVSRGYGAAARAIDWFGRVYSWPRMAIAGGDEFVSAIGYSAKLEADALDDALYNRGLHGPEAVREAADVVENAHRAAQISETVDFKDPEALARVERLAKFDASAADYVRELTFTQETGKFTKTLLKHQHDFPAIRWFTFFARTGANIARTSTLISPVGGIGQGVGAARALANGGGAKAREELAMASSKVAVSTGFLYAAWDSYNEQKFTGSGPRNPEQRELWRQTHEPYSWWTEDATSDYVGPNGTKGYWTSYARLDPFAIQFQVLAEVMDGVRYMDEPTFSAFGQELHLRLFNIVDSKTYFQGISDMLGIIDGRTSPAQAGVNLGKNFMPQSAAVRNQRTEGTSRLLKDKGEGFELDDDGKAVPRVQGAVAEWLGTGVSSFATELGSAIQGDMPEGLRDEWAALLNNILDARLEQDAFGTPDAFGDLVDLPGAVGPDTLSGIVASHKADDPASREMLKEGVLFTPSRAFKTWRGIELTPEQQDFARRMYRKPPGGNSKTMKEMLTDLVASEEYLEATENVRFSGVESGRRIMIQRRINARVQTALGLTAEKYPVLQKALIQQKVREAQGVDPETNPLLQKEVEERRGRVINALIEAVN